MDLAEALSGMPKDWKPILRACDEAGWRFRSSGSGIMCLPPDKNVPGVAMHKTPASKKRSLENKISEFRRAGLDI